MERTQPCCPDFPRPIRGLSRTSLPSDPHHLSRRAFSPDRVGLALFHLCGAVVGIDRADAGPCLSICPVAPRAFQDAPHLLRQSARPLRGFRLDPAPARPLAVDACSRALRHWRSCDHPRHRLERSHVGCRRRRQIPLARGQRAWRGRRVCRIDRRLAPAFNRHPLPHLSGRGAALVGVGIALRGCRGEFAPAHRTGL